MPSSISSAQTCRGALSANLGLSRMASSSSRSRADSAFGAGAAAARGTRTGCHCACGKRWRVISPVSSHAFFTPVTGSSRSKVSSLTWRTAALNPRSRRASPKAQTLFP